MKLVSHSIRYPVSTAVAVLLIALFGGIALYRIPIQLIPTVDRPEIQVQTSWPGALPAEVERQITQEQEDQLKGIEGLEQITSNSGQGQSQINLVFQIGTDVNRALLDVSNRLQQVQRYPEDSFKPVVRATSSEDQAIAWFALVQDDPAMADEPLDANRDLIDDFVAPTLERVPGVAATNVYGGTRRQMHFYTDPTRLASRGLTIAQLANALSAENANVSGGDFDEGKANYTVRTAGEYTSPEDIEAVVVAHQNGVPIFARDVGFARLDFEKKQMHGYYPGFPI